MFAAEPVQGVSFLVEMNKVGRVDVLSEAARTTDGFGVGTAAADIKAKFGAGVTEQPNKYEPEITELIPPKAPPSSSSKSRTATSGPAAPASCPRSTTWSTAAERRDCFP